MARHMAQGDLPEIFGSNWSPKAKLEFTQPLLVDAAKREILLFVAQQHDGRIALVSDIWNHVIGSEIKQFEGPSWEKFCQRFLVSLETALVAQLEAKMADEKDAEVIPRRTLGTFVGRRNTHFLIDMKLMLRRLAHYMSVTIEQRLEWQRNMSRTRFMDEALKEIFTDGITTPDGSRFGGKGFRSTWQEAVVAAATALKRNEDAGLDSKPGQGYDGDLVAPMIRDVVYP